MTENMIPLSLMIETLRDELENSLLSVKNRALRFELGEIELEMKLAVTQRDTANAGIKLWVLSTGATTNKKLEQLHTVKLKLKPHTSGELVLINDNMQDPGPPIDG